MIRRLLLAAFAAAVLAGSPAVAVAGDGPSLWEKYLHMIADQAPTRAEPTPLQSEIPRGERAARYYSCGIGYCNSSEYCCGTYCCPSWSGGCGYGGGCG